VKIELYGLKLPIIEPGADLARLIVESAQEYAGGIRDRDIIIITSKVVSKALGYLGDLSEIKPTREAMRLAKKTGEDPRFIQAILDNSEDILFVIPFRKLVEKGLIDLDKIAKDPERARKVVDQFPYLFIVRREKSIYSDAGIDFSNHPKGIFSIPPPNLDRVARDIREKIEKLTGKSIAVIITDTEIWLSLGSIDIARGVSGIQVVTKEFGEDDLYGKPKFGGVDIIVHELACASALLMGQTRKGVPAVLVRGYEYEPSEEGISNYHIGVEGLRRAVKEIITSSAKIIGLKWLLKFLIRWIL